ncbi:Putative mRNA decapping complex subunit 2 [[Torrubiella] hemipterigena]|uniref:Putative mRNA decapping complex subunit 2 n=1 Tax=[Torrubiella] hemipterigena TaxID=1531966 RepID=A0A0A1T4Y4_9HYPO|nr:Putative mRNA decapping complex subunit 2 [[Torrubiella] hemipterigena]
MNGRQMQLEDWLDDLCVRFIINLPEEDLSSVARLCFQVEEAQWFYEDFIRPLDPSLPSLSLRVFCLRIFQHCPLLASFSVENHTKAFEEFLQYKTRIPVRGAILLNHEMDSCVLVKGWKKGANWSFPRGKINKDEDDLDCAIREVYEETGLELREAGLVPEGKAKYIEINMREQQLRLYVFRDVPMDTNFQPRTRKEISKIQWYKLSELPTFRKKTAQAQNDGAHVGNNKFYMVAPFLVPLKKWIVSQKKQDEKKLGITHYNMQQAQMSVDDAATEDDTWAPGRDGARSQIPPIETLDGATQELQRLLKVQPPTQGLQQAATRQDKAGALLSILQSKSAPQQQQQQQQQQIYPGEPQYQQQYAPNNEFMHLMQPPPQFLQQGNNIPPQAPMPVEAAHLRHATDSAQLMHPRPSLPQVQKSVFATTPGLENQPPAHAPPPQQANHNHGMAGQKPANLSGASMALLNAFKRDAPQAPSSRDDAFSNIISNLGKPKENNNPIPTHQVPLQQMQMQHLQQSLPPNIPNPLRAAEFPSPPSMPSLPSHPSELAGSSVRGGAVDHRSALLGMFKAQEPAPAVNHQMSPPQASHAMPAPPQQQQGASISLDQLFISKQPRQPAPPRPASNANTNASIGAMLGTPSRPSSEAHGLIPPPSQQARLGPSPHAIYPPNYQGPGAGGARLGGPDSKQQLLSLFGNSQRSGPQDMVHEIAQGTPMEHMPSKTRVSSLASMGDGSRRGSETPISPADESFLLGYLQSLTNEGAKR